MNDWTKEKIRETATSIIKDQLLLDEEQIVDESSFMEDLGADSLDTVELVMGFEEEFSLDISEEDAEIVTQTVGKAITYLEGKLLDA